MVQPAQNWHGQGLTDTLDGTGIGASFCKDRGCALRCNIFDTISADDADAARRTQSHGQDNQKRYSERSFKPLVLVDARDLIKLVDDEDIRIADYVTKLTNQRRWGGCEAPQRFCHRSLCRAIARTQRIGYSGRELEDAGEKQRVHRIKVKAVSSPRGDLPPTAFCRGLPCRRVTDYQSDRRHISY